MAKRRPTIPIAHADDLPTIAFTDEQWQAIERAYGRQLNADVRQQITTVTAQYRKDCAFEPAAPKAMAQERIERIRRGAGDLEEAFSASIDDELPKEQQEQQQSAHSYADGLIRQHLDERRSRARDKLHHFRHALKSLVVACDCALNDLSAAEGYPGGEAWEWWIQALTQIVQRHDLPYGARIVGTSGEPSPFVSLVRALQEHVPPKHMFSDEALAKAIRRAQGRTRDK
jgi:hypothetical protein